MLDVQKWLQDHHSNGVELGMKELLHYRVKAGMLELKPKRKVQASLAGAYLAKTKGRGMEFDEARHYQAGDDIRAIDWRVTARTGKTHTKLYQEEKERPVFVLADLSQSMHFGTELLFKSVQVAHLASAIAWSARKRGDRIGGVIFNQQEHIECKPYARQKAVLSLLSALVKLHQPVAQAQEHKNGFADACARLRHLAHPGSLIFIISDFSQLDLNSQRHITQMSKHSEVNACVVADRFEQQLPESKIQQELALTDGQDQQQIILGEKRIAQHYAQRSSERIRAIEHTLKLCRARLMNVSAGIPLEQQLTKGARA